MRRLGEYGALLALLAIPAGIFMYWQKNATAKRKAAMKAVAPVASGPMFQEGSAAETGRKVEASAAPVGAGAVASAAVPTQDAPASAPAAAAAPEAAAAAAPVDGAVPVAEVDGATQAPVSLYAPKSARDPFESVSDRTIIKLVGERDLTNRRLAAEAIKRAKAVMVKTAPRKKSVEDLTILQGIMEVQGRLTAIVNNEMVAKGDTVPGLGVKVISITQNSVTFSNKGKGVFTKRIKEKKGK